MSAPRVLLRSVFLPHSDPEASLAFYRDVLGFEVRQQVAHGGLHWNTVGPPGQPDVDVVLHSPGADPGTTDAERRTVAEMMAKGTYAAVVLAADDLDALLERASAAGAEVVQEPMDQPWGVRDCALRDPAGTMVRVQQR